MSFMWFLIGMWLGAVIVNLVFISQRVTGILRIDCSNPEKELYRFEIDDIDKLSQKKEVLLKIVKVTNLSQK